MKIQHTNITDKDGVRVVDLLIADNPDINTAREMIRISVPVQLGEYPRLVEIELAALQRARDILGHEIQHRTSASGRDY